MKNYPKKIISLVLASFLCVFPSAAVGATDGGAETGSGANTVRKFTPVIDGVIDEEYLSSFHIDHEWPEERTPENYSGGGIFAFDEETGETSYGFDAQASSYFLWDDESIYIAFEVTDDDYGCIDDAHYEIAYEYLGYGNYAVLGPYFQDGIALKMSCGDQSATLLLTRDGKTLCKILSKEFEEDNWCDAVLWLNILEGKTESYYVARETEDGYVLELCLKVRENMRAEMLCDGSSFCFDGFWLQDSPPDAKYIDIGSLSQLDWYRPDDSWLFRDVMELGVDYKTEDGSLTLTLSDEEAVVMPPYDLTADGAFDAKDLTRLMRVIAGDGAATVAQSADINGDGAVDVKDMTRMMKHLAGAEA